MINVTKPFLPPKDEYLKYVDEIWQRAWLTNNGPIVNELELKLKKYLNVKHLLFLNNGTMALQLAIKALDLTGEIITTPNGIKVECSKRYIDERAVEEFEYFKQSILEKIENRPSKTTPRPGGNFYVR